MQKPIAWPGPLARMEPSQRHLTLALAASLALHAVVLSLHFGLPQALELTRQSALDVILVNSKSALRPPHAQALAQANLDGGGNVAEKRRASTPLPATRHNRVSRELARAQRRIAAMEHQQQEILAALARPQVVPIVPPKKRQAAPVSGLEMASRALAIARLQGEISRRIEAYNKRPRRTFIGARTREYRFAQYIEDWRLKIERIGDLNYPQSARGHIYGSLVITVAINSDGSLSSVEINRPSRYPVLNHAALRIVHLAAPFAAFTPAMKRDTDILEITRLWSFTNGDTLRSE